MKSKRFLAIVLFLIPVLLFGALLPAQASPSSQQYATPTPGPDGRIIYIVQPGDTCTRISLLNGVSIDQIRAYNPQLDDNCTLIEGSELVIGLAGPALVSPTAGPSPTPEPATPTPTPPPGTTEICILLYDDVNGDALRQTTELGIAGGAVSVSNTAGTYSEQQVTVSEIDPNTEEPVQTCFSDVPAGEYNVSVAVPDNYNPTMEMTYNFMVNAGDRAFIDFGAQSKEVTAAGPEANPDNGSGGGGGGSPILGILGGLLLLGGVGLGWYAYQQRKPASKLKKSGLLKK